MPVRQIRRPSPATLIALAALFVALGGPAHAARLIGGKDIRRNAISSEHVRTGAVSSSEIKNRGIRTWDLAASTIAGLRAIPDASITAAKLAVGQVGSRELADNSIAAVDIGAGAVGQEEIGDGAVGRGEIRSGAVGPSEIAGSSVDSDEVADGGLRGVDIARFAGAVPIADEVLPPLTGGSCTSTVVDAAPVRQTDPPSSIADDVVLVGTPESFPANLVVEGAPVGQSQLSIRVCNVGSTTPTDPPAATFRYLSFDL